MRSVEEIYDCTPKYVLIGVKQVVDKNASWNTAKVIRDMKPLHKKATIWSIDL